MGPARRGEDKSHHLPCLCSPHCIPGLQLSAQLLQLVIVLPQSCLGSSAIPASAAAQLHFEGSSCMELCMGSLCTLAMTSCKAVACESQRTWLICLPCTWAWEEHTQHSREGEGFEQRQKMREVLMLIFGGHEFLLWLPNVH